MWRLSPPPPPTLWVTARVSTANLPAEALVMHLQMQCMQKKSIDVRVCYGFSSAEDIECTKYSGILVKKSNDAWVFEHNNFREYLAAKYLSELDVETIRQIIFDTNHKVKDSWLNVLSFLVALYPNDSLLNLIAETDIEIFVKFEQDRLNDAERFRIFESTRIPVFPRNGGGNDRASRRKERYERQFAFAFVFFP